MSLINLFAAIGKAFSDRRRAQARADLIVLDDHLLADIGLRRSDIVAGFATSVVDAAAMPAPAARPRAAAVPGHFPPF